MIPFHPLVPTDLQAEAEAYQLEFTALNRELQDLGVRRSHDRERGTALNRELQDLGVRRSHNRERGLALIQRMRSEGVNTLCIGHVLLRPHRDGRGFERIPLTQPTIDNLASTTLKRGVPMPLAEFRPVFVAVPRQPGDLARLQGVLQKLDMSGPNFFAPRAALADLDEDEALLVLETAARCFREVLISVAQTPPDPQSLPEP